MQQKTEARAPKANPFFVGGRKCLGCCHWERMGALDDGNIYGACAMHERTMLAHEKCEDWNKGHTPTNSVSRNKYFCRSMSDQVAAQPLVQRARTIAAKRGFQTESARWWEVLHTSHLQLCAAHQEGQSAGIERIRMIVERLAPAVPDGVRPSMEQRVEQELVDRMLAVIDRQAPVPPEIPSTGE